MMRLRWMEKIANGENVGRAKISAVSIDIGPGAGDVESILWTGLGKAFCPERTK